MLTLFGDALFFSLLLAVPVLEYVEVGSDGVDTSPIELIFDEGSRVRWKGLELPCVDWNGGCGRNYTQVRVSSREAPVTFLNSKKIASTENGFYYISYF